jgi:hypothetical protein
MGDLNHPYFNPDKDHRGGSKKNIGAVILFNLAIQSPSVRGLAVAVGVSHNVAFSPPTRNL